VGDSRGAVTVYRVLTPPLITHMGPVQQAERLKAAVMASCDPVSLLKIREGESKTDKGQQGQQESGAAAGAGEAGQPEPAVQQR